MAVNLLEDFQPAVGSPEESDAGISLTFSQFFSVFFYDALSICRLYSIEW